MPQSSTTAHQHPLLLGLASLMALTLLCAAAPAPADKDASLSEFPEALSYHMHPIDDGFGTYTEDVCSVIFPTAAVASHYCPPGRAPVMAYDFWKNQPLGWSCDCAPNN